MPVYLRWLRAGSAARRDGHPDEPRGAARRPRTSWSTAPGSARDGWPATSTCSPVRGQVVLVEGVEVDRWWLDSAGPTYVVPRSDTVVVGGTDEDGDWSRTPSPETAAEILARATRLVPELARARVVAHRVGLRPVRPEVRLEAEGRVVHCYGHGGAGVTVSWGCADEVTGPGRRRWAERRGLTVSPGRGRSRSLRRSHCAEDTSRILREHDGGRPELRSRGGLTETSPTKAAVAGTLVASCRRRKRPQRRTERSSAGAWSTRALHVISDAEPRVRVTGGRRSGKHETAPCRVEPNRRL